MNPTSPLQSTGTQQDVPKDFHGSDIDAVAAYFQVDASSMISFAANVNPLGISPLLKKELSKHLDVISSYPERDYHTLRAAIGEYVHADSHTILVGNGSTELISGVIRSICPKDAVLIAPSYSEYEREVKLCGGNLRYFPLSKENNWKLSLSSLLPFLKPETDMLILCNPNNPTSNAVPALVLKKLLTVCKERDIMVMIDETYIEFSDHIEQFEAIPLTSEFDNLIVLRGISKFFAAPGLRLGYGICSNQNLRDSINRHKDPWTINSLAAKAGEIMFSDTLYQEQTKTLILQEKQRMSAALAKTGAIHIYPSESNFLLLEITKPNLTAYDCFAHCAKQGLMIRDCTNFPFLGSQFLRVCMMLPEDNQRLITALTEILTGE